MERIRRRWWTTVISAVAGLLVFTAVASGLFQIAVLMMPGYREQLADWVSDVAGRPVDIGGVHLLWRGLSPQIELSDIVLRDGNLEDDSDGALRAERLRLGFSVRRLARGDWMPDRVMLSGLQLRVEVDAAHRIRVAGFETRRPDAEPRNWRAALSRFSTVVLSDAQIRVRYAPWGEAPLDLAIEEGTLAQTRDGFDLDTQGALPARLGGAFEAQAEIRGDSDRIEQWSGRWQLQADDLVPAGWTLPGMAQPLAVQADALQAMAQGQFRDGRIEQVVLAAEAQRLSADGGLQADQPRLRMSWQPAGTGGVISVSEFGVADAPVAALRLRWSEQSLELDGPSLDLSTLAPWLTLAPTDQVRAMAALRGQLQNLHLRASRPVTEAGAWQYTLEGDLREGGWQPSPEASAVAVSGLAGRVVATDRGGRFSPAGGEWSLRFATADPAPMVFRQFRGDLLWTRQPDQPWLLRLPAFDWRVDGAQGQGRGSLTLNPDRGPELDLQMAFAVSDLTALKPLMPARWSEDLRSWLGRAIVAGEVPSAELSIKGPIRDFPFGARPSGEWRLALPLRNATVAFSRRWPALTAFSADLVFTANRLELVAQSGWLADLPIRTLRAEIPALHLGPIQIDGAVRAPLSSMFDVVAQSPLQQRLRPLVAAGPVQGDADLDLRLAIPLRDMNALEVDGQLRFDGLRWALTQLPAPLEDLSGTVHFTNRQIAAEGLRARLLRNDLRADIRPAETHPGDLEVQATVDVDSPLAAAFAPALARLHMEGASDWTLRQALGVADAELRIESRLEGTAVRLPAPFGKPASEALPLTIRLLGDADGRRRMWLDVGGRLASAQIRLPSKAAPDDWAAELRFGAEAPPPEAVVQGLAVSGALEQADVGEWRRLFPAGAGDRQILRQLDLQVGRLRLGGFSLADQGLSLRHADDGMHLDLRGAAEGTLHWNPLAETVAAQFERLTLGFEGFQMAPARPETSAAPTLRPDTWPALNARAETLSLNGLPLGQAQLQTQRLADGVALERFELSGGSLEGRLQGEWRRSDTRGRAALSFDLESTAVEPTLQAFGFAPSLEAAHTRLDGSLQWPDTAFALDWTRGEGPVRLRVRDGTLRTIEPGAGRVLGLMSFYALPRRLTLDFRDVVDDGLRFDTVAADFALAAGVASTDNLTIRAPSLRMEIDGEIDLAQRRLNQRVRVFPGVSGGVTLGAALLGGPAAGAIILLAQELLEKPLDQVTQFGYRVQGSWDNPDVSPLDAREAAPEAPPTTP